MITSISDDIKTGAERLVAKLRIERERNETTPWKPKTGEKLMQAYNQKFGTAYDNRHARLMVHYAREVLKAPIGYNIKRGKAGYYWCANAVEYGRTKGKLVNRAMKILQAAAGGEGGFKNENQQELFE